MVATFVVKFDKSGFLNAPAANPPTVTNLRFNNEDTNDQDLASPIVIPGAGTAYSFWKHIFLLCTVAPDTKVDNVKYYTAGADIGWGVGSEVFVGDGNQTKNSGSSAGYDPGQAAILTTHDTITTKTNIESYLVGTPRIVNISESTPTAGEINAINETTDYLVFSLEVTSSAVAGTKTPVIQTFQYDEV